jgi:acetyl-CoA carboxylase biotin carboxyl carrier protein
MTMSSPDLAPEENLRNLSDQAVDLVGRLPGQVSRIRVRAGSAEIEVEWQAAAGVPGDVVPAAWPAAVEPTAAAPAAVGTAVTVRAPVVGVFYTAPSPDESAFVAVGEQVTVGQQVGIIEAMKLMNHITAEVAGTVTAISVSSGESVEFDQLLMEIEPS